MLLLLLACSDYDLQGKDDRPALGETADTPTVDTSQDTTSPEGDDSGTGGGSTTDEPGPKLDVALVMDDAYFYDCYHADLALRTDELVNALFATGLDVAISIATYDDYQVDGEWYASDDGLPYTMVQQLTTDEPLLLAAAPRLLLEWGGDWQGSGYEALVQLTQGAGYDQDCDGRYDGTTDVKPFNASSGDAFAGAVTGSANTTVPGTGTNPGVGFRGGGVPKVVVLFTENGLRDPALGHEVPSGTCPGAASQWDAVSAINAVNAKLLSVNAYEFQDIDPTLQNQLEDLARDTSSYWDADGDGSAGEMAVLSGSWDWPDVNVVVDAIRQLGGV